MRLATPYIFLCALILAIISISYVVPRATRTHDMALDARDAYINAIAATRSQLVALVRETAENPTLKENIEWDLKHSINKTLEGSLIEGQLDRLTLMAENCQTIAASGLNHTSGTSCNQKNMQNYSLYWDSSSNQIPSLNFSVQVPNEEGRKLFLMGTVFLDTIRWMPIYPDLARYKAMLELEIKPIASADDAVVIIEEGSPKVSQATLVSNSFSLKWAFSKPRFPWTSVIYLALIALFATGYLWWMNKSLSDQKQLNQETFALWIRQFTKIDNVSKQHFLEQIKTAPPLEYAKSLLEKYQEQSKDRLRKNSEEILSLHSEIRQLKAQIGNNEEKLEAIVPIESLAIQMAEGREKLSKDISSIKKRIDKIIHTSTQGVSRSTATLKTLLTRWQTEVDTRGARRFFRALSEQTVDDGQSLLEQQLMLLQRTTSSADNQSAQINREIQLLSEELREVFRQTSYWCDLSYKSDQNVDHDCSLMDVCISAQQMIIKSSGLSPHFSNQLEFGQERIFTQVPKNIWISIIFHIYDMFLDLSGDHPAIKISTQLKRDSEKTLLILSIEDERSDEIDMKNVQSKDFEIARKLCKQFNLNCERLPDLSGAMAVAISYENRGHDEIFATDIKFDGATTADRAT